MIKKSPFFHPCILLIFICFGWGHTQAQTEASTKLEAVDQNVPPSDSVILYPDDPILAALDSLWLDERLAWQDFQSDSVCLNVYQFPFDSIPQYPDSVIVARLAALDKQTPLDLEYNPYVRAYIDVYVERRRDVAKRVLGLSELYYPLFEEKLDLFDIPLELKHLAVVESALNATARSRVGASGLWQFMYNTGRVYGLEVNSYIDDRSDPYKSTIAACRYMRFLYGMYGDWNLVLAAYNSGPGNVNKAIRRSGGHRDYWKLRPYLPRETRGYVPAFIAVNYMMNYAAEHNLYPRIPERIYSEIDTLKVCRETTFDQISQFTGVSISELELLNPSLKRNVIPETQTCRTLYLPTEAVGKFLANEDSMYMIAPAPQAVDGFIVEDIVETYTVRRGDVLGLIAQRHGVGVSQIRAWNNLRGNRIYPGQRLEIRKTERRKVGDANSTTASKNTVEKEESKTTTRSSNEYRFHTVERGDTLWDIAKKYPGISVDDLKSINDGMNFWRLKPGQKIKIPPVS